MSQEQSTKLNRGKTVGLIKILWLSRVNQQKSLQVSYATAFLIRNNVLLTSAHAVYDSVLKNCDIVEFYLPNDQQQVNIRRQAHYKSTKVVVSHRYAPSNTFNTKDRPKCQEYDYALVFLDNEVANAQPGKLTASQDLRFSDPIQIQGFPCTKQTKKEGIFHCKSYKGRVIEGERRLLTDIYSFPGLSGSPIYLQRDDSLKLVGIHLGLTCNGFEKYGLLFNKSLLQELNQIIEDQLFEINRSKQIQLRNYQLKTEENSVASIPVRGQRQHKKQKVDQYQSQLKQIQVKRYCFLSIPKKISILFELKPSVFRVSKQAANTLLQNIKQQFLNFDKIQNEINPPIVKNINHISRAEFISIHTDNPMFEKDTEVPKQECYQQIKNIGEISLIQKIVDVAVKILEEWKVNQLMKQLW